MPIEFAPPPAQLGMNIQPPQSTDPLQTLAQLAQLRNETLQRKNLQLGLEQGQMNLDSRRALIQSFVQGEGDYDKTFQIAVASGKVLPADLMALKEHKLKMDTDAANLEKAKLDAFLTHNDIYRGALSGVTNQEQLDAANATAKRAGVFEGGRIAPFQTYSDPEHLQAFINGIQAQSQSLTNAKLKREADEAEQRRKLAEVQTTEGQQKVAAGERAALKAAIEGAEIDPETGTPIPSAWSAIRNQFPKQNLPEKPSRQWIARNTGQLGTPKSETELAIAANDPNRTPAEREQATNALNSLLKQHNLTNTETELAIVATDPKRTPAERAAANAALRRLDQSKIASRPNITIAGVPNAPLTGDAANLHGEEFLKTLPPAFAAQIKALAAGNGVAPSGRNATSGPGLQITNALYQYDPEYTPLLAQARKESLKEFTSTQKSHAGGAVIALKTLIHHGDLYQEVADSMKNGTWRYGNALWNTVATAFGKTPPTEANLVARFLAGETATVATGGVPAEGEVNGILKSLGSDASPDQIKAAGRRIVEIAAGRMIPYKNLIEKNHLEKFVDILGPHEREVLQRRGFDPETMQPVAAGATGGIVVIDGNGREHPFTSEAAAKHFEDLVKAAGGTTRRKK